jgi:hypothetical protein
MKIKKDQKYVALIGCKHFQTEDNELNPFMDLDNDFFILPGDVLEINYIYEKGGKVFVLFSGEYENEYGIKFVKMISLETFNSCFEEVK